MSYASVGKPRSVLAGLSGGADSVALLVSLCALRQENGIKLSAVHVNHGLRENASLDEAYCAEICTRLDVQLIVKRVSVSGESNIEAVAREARYAAFDEAMRETGADVLALAHHMDDQAETVIMHLLYGAGTAGLAGMRELRGEIWRPFLNVRRKSLRDFLIGQSISWREDESNEDVAFTRNRIRADVMPCLEGCYPEAVSAIARSAQILQSEDAYLDALADTWLSQHASSGAYPFLLTESLINQHPAMQRRILRKYADRLDISLDYLQTERLRTLLVKDAGETENLSGGWQALRTRKRLHFLHPELQLKRENPSAALKTGEMDGLPQDAVTQPIPDNQLYDLQLRTRRTGDYIQPFGMSGTKSLKEYMIDHAVDRPFRDGWPLACRGSEVLWVIGIGASEKLRVSKDDTTAKFLIYTGELPDQIRGGD